MTEKTRYAITRAVADDMSACELSFVARSPIDIQRAHAQHAAYARALRELGCRPIALPALPGLADAVFVEDVALVFDEIAVMTRPGAASRRPEQPSVEAILREYRALLRIEAPGTLDGGDVLRIGHRVFVGASARSNAAGREQLTRLLAPFDYEVCSVAIRDCLHLKSAVTRVAENTVLIQPEWIDVDTFADYERIAVDAGEPHAANALMVGECLIYPENFPCTRAKLEAAGLRVLTVDVGELQKAEGAVTCCSIVFEH